MSPSVVSSVVLTCIVPISEPVTRFEACTVADSRSAQRLDISGIAWNSGSPTSKKLSSCVRPGVFEVRASPFFETSALISELLPTLERPAKAISGGPSGGRNFSAGTPRMNTQGAVKISAPIDDALPLSFKPQPPGP